MFSWYVPLASQSPYPIIVYTVANYRPHLSHFWANMKFSRSQLSHFLIYKLTHFLDSMKNTLLFICSTNILVRLLTAGAVNMKNCLPKMCDHILVTLLKMGPRYSQSSRENATPFSCTSPLASYKEVHPRGFEFKYMFNCKYGSCISWDVSSSIDYKFFQSSHFQWLKFTRTSTKRYVSLKEKGTFVRAVNINVYRNTHDSNNDNNRAC